MRPIRLVTCLLVLAMLLPIASAQIDPCARLPGPRPQPSAIDDLADQRNVDALTDSLADLRGTCSFHVEPIDPFPLA